MSIFGSIVSAIFGSKHAATATQPAGSSTTTQSASPSAAPSAGSPAATAAAPAGAPGSAAQPISRAEVEAMIAKIAAGQDEDMNWRQSIVDLMKLLKLDSSLNARKQLAQELGYSGALDGSADMNIWLHRQVMVKLAETGGKVPESLRT
jgi:3-oxoacyl-ACP reductase-like protein